MYSYYKEKLHVYLYWDSQGFKKISIVISFHYYLFRCFAKCLKSSKKQFHASWVRDYLFYYNLKLIFNTSYIIGTYHNETYETELKITLHCLEVQ